MSDRIVSMDQFRGYTVAGMFVVNFVSGLAAIHPLLKHHNTWFSYADSIMPSFFFAAGFSYRLALLKRISRDGAQAAYRHAVVRSLALILVSVVLLGLDDPVRTWSEMTPENARNLIGAILKARMWNVLAIIGAAQLVILPVVAASWWVRLLTILVFMLGHLALCHSFNYEFVYGRPNWMNDYWGAGTTRAWDGGFFGVLMWSVPMLAGTLTYDLFRDTAPSRGTVARLFALGAVVMMLGYGLSCLSTLYDAEPDSHSPVLPPLDRVSSRSVGTLLANPPFVPVPPPAERKHSYWLMDKRIVSIPFTLFSTGLALALYGLFVLACDLNTWQLNLFRILGQNPLAAYLLHYPILHTVRAFVPGNSPLWWCLVGLAVFFVITTTFVRYLDRHRLYLRL